MPYALDIPVMRITGSIPAPLEYGGSQSGM